MRREVRTLAVIPARGGSTRVPRKNLAPVGRHPLIAHTILAARQAEEVNAVVVSTDSDEIAEVSLCYGAQVVRRPAELATAEAPSEPALIHAILAYEAGGVPVDLVVMLQATSPLRSAARIDEAVRLQRRTRCDSVVSVVRDVGYYFLGELDAEARLSLSYDPRRRLRTQEIPPRYRENGAIYVMKRAQIVEGGCRIGGDVRALVMDERESVDIDSPLDLELCRLLAGLAPPPAGESAGWSASASPSRG
jgi:CMP-N,N'-diacetyllegionaminic acid synthase